jgi:predicted kinase
MDEDGHVCTTPTQPWIVFTAGAMGAGKSWSIRHLAQRGYFPLKSFVTVDPDEIRRHLPEFDYLLKHHPEHAGEWTRKEAGFVAELLTQASLDQGRNVLVDGSLRDAAWYRSYFGTLRDSYSRLQIGILHITAPRDVVLQRANERSKTTGRVVPRETLEHALEQVPKSIALLRPECDYFAEIHNAHSLQLRTGTWNDFQQAWSQNCKETVH